MMGKADNVEILLLAIWTLTMGALDIYLLAAVDWTLAKASQYKIRTGETEIGMIHNNKCLGVDIMAHLSKI